MEKSNMTRICLHECNKCDSLCYKVFFSQSDMMKQKPCWVWLLRLTESCYNIIFMRHHDVYLARQFTDTDNLANPPHVGRLLLCLIAIIEVSTSNELDGCNSLKQNLNPVQKLYSIRMKLLAEIMTVLNRGKYCWEIQVTMISIGFNTVSSFAIEFRVVTQPLIISSGEIVLILDLLFIHSVLTKNMSQSLEIWSNIMMSEDVIYLYDDKWMGNNFSILWNKLEIEKYIVLFLSKIPFLFVGPLV